MAGDIKLNDNGVVVEGGELHNSGPGGGFSFADRTKPNERWVLYAQDGQARLWSHATGDKLVVGSNGNVGIGTKTPARILHVEGNEVHSGGAGGGFSFGDRAKPGLVDNPQNGERWLWYARNGQARLWSGKDVWTLQSFGGNTFHANLDAMLTVKNSLVVENGITAGFVRADTLSGAVEELRGTMPLAVPQISTVRCRAVALSLDDPRAPTYIEGDITQLQRGKESEAQQDPTEPTPGPLPPHVTPLPPRFALLHEYVPDQTDNLVINHGRCYVGGVRIEGNVQVTGALTNASSIALKNNVAQLSTQQAMTTLQQLNPVTFTYKADAEQQQHVGFVAEDVPELVAQADRKGVSAMDIVGVLTKVVQEQQRMLAALGAEIMTLKQRKGGA